MSEARGELHRFESPLGPGGEYDLESGVHVRMETFQDVVVLGWTEPSILNAVSRMLAITKEFHIISVISDGKYKRLSRGEALRRIVRNHPERIGLVRVDRQEDSLVWEAHAGDESELSVVTAGWPQAKRLARDLGAAAVADHVDEVVQELTPAT